MTTDNLAQSLLDGDELAQVRTNQDLETMSAQERVCWGCENLPGELVVSSSFGIQSAVMLHLVNSIRPGIPVILIDTGYLFTETYQFIDQLSERFDLNLQVYSARMSTIWQETRYGQLWRLGEAGIKRYNRINKVEPMDRALADLSAGTWKTAVDQSKVDSYTVGFLTPMTDRTDIEFRLSFDDSENFGKTTALTVYLYYFGGS